MKMDFIIVNGQILKKEEFVPFEYSYSLIMTRKIWHGYGGIPLFRLNIQNLKHELTLLKMHVPDLLKDENEFFRIVKRMLNKSRFYRSGHVTLKIFAEPVETRFLVSCSNSDEFGFPVSQQGILLNFSEIPVFSNNPWGRFAFYNVILWRTAEISFNHSLLQNQVFLNENGNVANCMDANIFAIKGRDILTPAPETGCYIDAVRELVMEVARKLGLKIRETAELKKGDLFEMDEIFLASEAGGIQWVMGIENKRFVHRLAALIHEKLDAKLKELAAD